MTPEILCPDRIHHTDAPTGYIQWHSWAKKMALTHKQVKCTGCDLYVIWVPKKQKEAEK